MLTAYFEPFTLLAKHAEPDGMGGQRVTLEADVDFRGVLTQVAGTLEDEADQLIPHADPALLHDFDVTLAPGDLVRREEDGAIYRVTGRTADMRSPAFSGLRFAQVPVERVMSP